MQQESSDELDRLYCDRYDFVCLSILCVEGHHTVIKGRDAAVGDGDPVGITGNVFEHSIRFLYRHPHARGLKPLSEWGAGNHALGQRNRYRCRRCPGVDDQNPWALCQWVNNYVDISQDIFYVPEHGDDRGPLDGNPRPGANWQ